MHESHVHIPAADGYALAATVYGTGDPAPPGIVAIINCATGVKASYYSRYARFLAAHGLTAIGYDYRGIGASRPGSMRRLNASKSDWGSKDFEGVLRWAAERYPGARIVVAAHSIGGVIPGFSASIARIDRMLTVAAQFAYWRDYAHPQRARMFLKWHMFMPALTFLLGYFPGRRLGWLEDLPAGVAYEWAFRGAALEGARHRDRARGGGGAAPPLHFAELQCPMLAYSIADDPYGTPEAILRLLAYYSGSDRVHVAVRPQDLGLAQIGHFTFFHDRFKDTLWRESLAWLKDGIVARAAAHTLPAQAVRRT